MTWLDGNLERFDESSARVRPPKRGTKPRTKIRPLHEDSTDALVITVDRGRYLTLVNEGRPDERFVIGKRARELSRTPIVTGDIVDLVGDVSGEDGSLSRIVRVHDRITVLRRSADDTDTVERMIVANADQMLIVVAAANPEPRQRLVDRYVVAAFDAGITPILCITKTDLADPTEFLTHFTNLNITVITSRSDDPPIDALSEALLNHRTVAVGHSGVGKSTLVNALVPGADRAVGVVNDVTGRGRHTSSSTVSFRFPGGGWLIDTPGVRSFGLGHVRPESVLSAFTDLAEIAESCPRGCNHRDDDCAIVEAVVAGELGPNGAARLDSVQRLIASLDSVG
jgi:ribosome biogenesis GTPase